MGDYPAKIFRDRPVEFDGKVVAAAQLLHKPFSDGHFSDVDLRRMRKEIGQVQEARLRAIRCNELDGSADYQANLGAATTRSAYLREKMGVLVEELSNAGIYFMPCLFDWQWGLDQNAAVRAAMPVGYPMFGVTSLYASLIGQTTDAFGAIDKGTVRRFLINLAVFGDGGTYQSANSGLKPGANRTTAMGMGGDALINAIWNFIAADCASFLTDLGWGTPGHLIWPQMMNGPENPSELTLDVFLPFGYFANSTVDLKQSAGNAIAALCGVHAPRFGFGANQEASAEARDQLYHQRKEWAAKILSDICYGNIDSDNVLLYRSMHSYRQGTFDSRLAGDPITSDGIYTEVGISARFLTEHRTAANGDRDASVLSKDYDADHVFWIEARQGVSLVLSTNGGRNTVTVAANASAAQLRAALLTLPGIGESTDYGGDLTVEFIHDPAVRGRMPYTRFTDPAGIPFYGYHVRLGGIGTSVQDSKSKRKRGVDITSSQSTDDVRIWQWVKGGVVDRGPGLKKKIRFLVEECGAEIIFLHAPLDTRGWDERYWSYGLRTDPDSYEAARIAAGRYRLDLSGWAMCDNEPEAHEFFWNWFGRYCESRNG